MGCGELAVLFSPTGRRWPAGPDEGARSAKAVPGSPLIASHALGTSPRWGEESARGGASVSIFAFKLGSFTRFERIEIKRLRLPGLLSSKQGIPQSTDLGIVGLNTIHRKQSIGLGSQQLWRESICKKNGSLDRVNQCLNSLMTTKCTTRLEAAIIACVLGAPMIGQTIAGSRLWLCIFLFFIPFGSASTYDLGPELCGGVYGFINVTFSDRMTSTEALKQATSDISWLNQQYEDNQATFGYGRKNEITTLWKQLSDAVESRLNEDGGGYNPDISVPIGSEEQTAVALIDAGVISEASRAIGGCGEGDMVVLSLPRSEGQLSDPQVFSDYLHSRLLAYAARLEAKGTVERGIAIKKPLPPFFPKAVFTLSVPSELSRETVANNVWDRFKVVFELANIRGGMYEILVYATDLVHAPRTRHRNKSPSVEHFKIPIMKDSGGMDQEYVAAASVTRYLAVKPKFCIADSIFNPPGSKGLFGCEGSREELTKVKR